MTSRTRLPLCAVFAGLLTGCIAVNINALSLTISDGVVVAALGQRATGGYDVRVSRLATARDYLYVEITSTSPGPACGTTQAFSQPVDIVRVAKLHAPLVYVERALVRNC